MTSHTVWFHVFQCTGVISVDSTCAFTFNDHVWIKWISQYTGASQQEVYSNYQVSFHILGFYRLEQKSNHLNICCLYVQERSTCVTSVVGLHMSLSCIFTFTLCWAPFETNPKQRNFKMPFLLSLYTAPFCSLLLTGCPVQVSQYSLEAHLCVCEYRNRVCASGCGYTPSNTGKTQHNCISELRAELDLLR